MARSVPPCASTRARINICERCRFPERKDERPPISTAVVVATPSGTKGSSLKRCISDGLLGIGSVTVNGSSSPARSPMSAGAAASLKLSHSVTQLLTHSLSLSLSLSLSHSLLCAKTLQTVVNAPLSPSGSPFESKHLFARSSSLSSPLVKLFPLALASPSYFHTHSLSLSLFLSIPL